MPYQKRTFVTPAFPGYISGHSTFSRAAAEVLGVRSVTFLGFRDGELEVNLATRRAACREVRRLRPDVVVLKNGDRVTGTVVKKDAATLTVKSAHFGTISFPWDQVDTKH